MEKGNENWTLQTGDLNKAKTIQTGKDNFVSQTQLGLEMTYIQNKQVCLTLQPNSNLEKTMMQSRTKGNLNKSKHKGKTIILSGDNNYAKS